MESEKEFNYTRAGYVMKVVNGLVNMSPRNFGKYILTNS